MTRKCLSYRALSDRISSGRGRLYLSGFQVVEQQKEQQRALTKSYRSYSLVIANVFHYHGRVYVVDDDAGLRENPRYTDFDTRNSSALDERHMCSFALFAARHTAMATPGESRGTRYARQWPVSGVISSLT